MDWNSLLQCQANEQEVSLEIHTGRSNTDLVIVYDGCLLSKSCVWIDVKVREHDMILMRQPKKPASSFSSHEKKKGLENSGRIRSGSVFPVQGKNLK